MLSATHHAISHAPLIRIYDADAFDTPLLPLR